MVTVAPVREVNNADQGVIMTQLAITSGILRGVRPVDGRWFCLVRASATSGRTHHMVKGCSVLAVYTRIGVVWVPVAWDIGVLCLNTGVVTLVLTVRFGLVSS